MFSRKLMLSRLFSKHRYYCQNLLFVPNAKSMFVPQRHIQISVIGSTNDIGTNLALLLKQCPKIDKLHLYDDDVKIKGIAKELSHVPGGPDICCFDEEDGLNNAIRNSELVVMTYRIPRKPGSTREQMIAANAPAVQRTCRAMANDNPNAFLAIATNPINSLVPFASNLMYKYGCYNPFKVFGITHIDVSRARMLTANALNLNPLDISLPVIGGHSEDSVVPLFSNMSPVTSVMDPYKADTLTRLVRRAGNEVIYHKKGKDSATLGMAMSIFDFIQIMVDALKGHEVMVNCYCANPNFGTRFFSGPTKIGPHGIIEPCRNTYLYSDYETFLLNCSELHINRDVAIGENYVRFIETLRNH